MTDLVIQKGKTFERVIRWESQPFIYVPITGVQLKAPVEIIAPTHNIPDGWRVIVVSVKGTTELNTIKPPKAKDFKRVTVLGPDLVALNTVNASEFSEYIEGGYLQHYTPVDITGFIARMMIKDRVGGTILHGMSSTSGEITLDAVLKTITLTIPALTTQIFPWTKGVYDLEMESPAGVVTAILSGEVEATEEVTV